MLGDTFVLDTSFILEYLQGAPSVTRFLADRQGADLFISDITRLELLSFPRLDSAEKSRILEFLDHVEIVPVTPTIGDIAVAFRVATRRKLPDAIIAATAIHLGAALVTHDKELLASSFAGLTCISP